MKTHWTNSRNIKQLFGIYCSALMAVMFVLSIALITEAQKSILRFSMLHAQKNCEVLETSIHQTASQFESVLFLLRYDDAVRQVMRLSSYSQLSTGLIEDLSYTLSTKTDIPFLKDVALTSDLIRFSNLYLPTDLKSMDDAMPSSRNMVSLGLMTPKKPNAEKYLCFGCSHYADGQKVGNSYLSLDLGSLIASLPISQQKGICFALMDANGNVGILTALEASDVEASRIQELLQENRDSSCFSGWPFQKYVIHSTEVEGIGCTLYGIIDIRAVNSSLNNMYYFTLSMLLVLIGITILGNAFFRQGLVVPLNHFSQHITMLRKRPDTLQQAVPAFEISGCKEMQNIEKEFSVLLESIRTLTAEIQQKNEDLHQAELLRKNAEIKHLRSQINPHFLYNTLELIRADAIAGKVEQLSSITASMGKFYRYSIKGAPIVSLSEELDYVSAYLNIQQQRYEGHIRTIYNVSSEANDIAIPKMLLQPLVENAIIHGLEPSAEAFWTLFIGATVDNGILTLTVRDNGIGIMPQHLEQLKKELAAPCAIDAKIGLANVYARLRLQYGNSCRFHISSAPGDGTCITLQIPVSAKTDP